jgi:hypothetical protein
MPARKKRYWVIEITKGLEPVFRKRLAGKLSNQKIVNILQRLASQKLTRSEVIAASILNTGPITDPDPNQDPDPDADPISPLAVRVRTPSTGLTEIWLPAFGDYKASRCREGDALANLPETAPED